MCRLRSAEQSAAFGARNSSAIGMRSGGLAQSAASGAIGGIAAGVAVAVLAPFVPAGIVGGIIAGAVSAAVGNLATQLSDRFMGSAACAAAGIDWSSVAISAIGGALFGAVALRPGTATNQTVTSWAPAGTKPDLTPGRWVMTGGASIRNWLLSGIAIRGYPRANAVTLSVSRARLSYPRATSAREGFGLFNHFKGLLGQRQVIEP